MINLKNKVILVTGSSRGIGANLVENFVKNNYNVVINYAKSDHKANKLFEKIKELSGPDSVLCIQADVGNREKVNEMYDKIYQKYGRCDVLVNNAGINIDKPFLKMNLNEWQAVIDTIMTGTFNCSQEFALRYKGESGHIINIGAVTAITGRKNGINYCTARAGILNMTRCLALELAPKICVNTVTLGYIDTEEVITRHSLKIKENHDRAVSLVPSGRLGTPDDIFNAIYNLVNNLTYLRGQNIIIDGGYLMK